MSIPAVAIVYNGDTLAMTSSILIVKTQMILLIMAHIIIPILMDQENLYTRIAISVTHYPESH